MENAGKKSAAKRLRRRDLLAELAGIPIRLEDVAARQTRLPRGRVYYLECSDGIGSSCSSKRILKISSKVGAYEWAIWTSLTRGKACSGVLKPTIPIVELQAL